MKKKEMEIAIKWIPSILAEFQKATDKFGPFHSTHEGYAVIKEEIEELWDLIKKNESDPKKLSGEAIQVAAMALRFCVDICTDYNKF